MKNKISRAYEYAIYPNPEQINLFIRTFGCCRLIWNLMLAERIKHYVESHEQKEFTPATFKTEEREFLREVDSYALANEQMFLRKAYTNFFRKDAKFPKFKKKGDPKHRSYTTSNVNNTIKLDAENSAIRLPKVGLVKIRLHRNLPKDALIKNVTVKQIPSGKWKCSICFECPESSLKTKRKSKTRKAEKLTLGLDYKSDGLYVDSNGRCALMPHFFRNSQKKLEKAQRKLDRMAKHSNNYEEQRKKVAKLHEKVANQRKDFLHKESKYLADRYEVICVEDLNMQAMARSLKLGKATHDNGFGMFRTMLAYKLADRDGVLLKAEKKFPSSQRCHCCGEKNPEVKNMKVRKWTCPHCGAEHDRDENAAINLKQYALGLT